VIIIVAIDFEVLSEIMVKVKKAKTAKVSDKSGGKGKCKIPTSNAGIARKAITRRSYNASMLPFCQECGSTIDDDTKALQCEKCDRNCAWICLECLGLSVDWYESLDSADANAQLHWFCDECETKVFDKCDDQKSIIDMLKELRDHMNMIELKLDSKADSCAVASLDQQLQKLEVAVCQVVAAQPDDNANEEHSSEKVNLDVATVSTCVDEIVRVKLQEDREEEEEIEKRKTSIIIHGVTESQDQSTDNRIMEDNVQIEELLHKLDLDRVSVNKAIRLGKRPDSSDAKPRPLKVTLASEEQKIDVLKKAKNYLRRKEGENGVFIHQDLTPNQRKRRQELVKELKRRQSQGEQNLMIANWKIVERRRQVEH